jgi:hypothetical protein
MMMMMIMMMMVMSNILADVKGKGSYASCPLEE